MRRDTMKRLFGLSCALFSLLALLLSACSSAPDNGGGGNGGGDNGPAITSFTANPQSISVGGSSTLSWEVTGATSLSIRQDIGVDIGDVSVTSNSYVVNNIQETTNYTLIAKNAQDETTSSETKVTVEDVSETLTQLGFVNLSEQKPPTGAANVVASGIFLEFTEGEEIPGTFFTNPFEGRVDTCDVIFTSPEEGEGDTSVLPPFTPEGTPAYISAGAQVTLAAGGGTYATLEKTDATLDGETVTFYSANALGTPPGELTATVPGDEFPAFTDVALPTVPTFTLTAPAGADPITPTTTFTWNAGGDAVILISVTESDTESEGTVSVNCIAQDDGSFTFPLDVQDSLGDTFSGSLTSAGRQAFRTEIKGDAVLVLGASSTQFFGATPAGTKASFWASQF